MASKALTRKQAARKMRSIAEKAKALQMQLQELRYLMREAGFDDQRIGAVMLAADGMRRACGLEFTARLVVLYESEADEQLDAKAQMWAELAREGRPDAEHALKTAAERGNKYAKKYLEDIQAD